MRRVQSGKTEMEESWIGFGKLQSDGRRGGFLETCIVFKRFFNCWVVDSKKWIDFENK